VKLEEENRREKKRREEELSDSNLGSQTDYLD
jgi:hypothetical protein